MPLLCHCNQLTDAHFQTAIETLEPVLDAQKNKKKAAGAVLLAACRQNGCHRCFNECATATAKNCNGCLPHIQRKLEENGYFPAPAPEAVGS